MPALAQSVAVYIRKHRLLKAGDRAGVAVSGGADSVALLRLLLELRDEFGVVLSVVHFNHKLRGAEADADAAFVGELAQRHGMELHASAGSVGEHAEARRLSVEAAARELRYAFFFELLGKGTLDRIATGHSLDDQAETVLLRLARGTGTRGLAGIYPEFSEGSSQFSDSSSRRRSVVRPLLNVRRGKLVSYLQTLGQEWREDASNLDLRFTRNRVRRILPILESELNPSIKEALAETAEIARAEEDYWTGEVRAALPTVSGASGLSIPALFALPLALQRRVLRAAAEQNGLRLEFRQVEEILSVAAGEAGSVELAGGWSAARRGPCLVFERAAEKPGDYAYRLTIPGTVEVMELGTRVEAVLIEDGRGGYNPDNLFDAALVPGELEVRNWRAGDRFWPAHTKGPKKIKELLQDRQVRGAEKKLWPVVASGEGIIWVRGFPAARELQAGEGASRKLAIFETGPGSAGTKISRLA